MRRQPRQSIVQVGTQKLVINLTPVNSAAGKNIPDATDPTTSVSVVSETFRLGSGGRDLLLSVGPTPEDYDRYGFFVGKDPSTSQVFHKAKPVDSKIKIAREDKEMERSKKWTEMLALWDRGASPNDSKLIERIRKGIPNSKRASSWYHISNANRFAQLYPNPFELYGGTGAKYQISERTLDEIERDIDRTYPRHRLFVDKILSRGPIALRNVLRWYAAIDPEVGYCQGMGFLAGMFVIYMDEKTAFYTFCAAMQSSIDSKALRTLYLPSMAETQRALYVFGKLGKQHLGSLWDHLLAEGMDPTMYATEWLMTMFCRGFSFDLTTRVMDIYLKEGYKIVYRIALALIKNIESDLLDADFEEIMRKVRIIPELTDADTVFEIAWKIPVKHADIERYTNEYNLTKIRSDSDFGETSATEPSAMPTAEDAESSVQIESANTTKPAKKGKWWW